MDVVSDPERQQHAAIDWLLRQRDPGFADWEGFTAWLEADPRHTEVYDRIAATEAGVSDSLSGAGISGRSFEDAPFVAPPDRSSRRGIFAAATALAASVVAVIGVHQMRAPAELYVVATGPGQHRTVALDGGTSITLNGDTRVTLDRENLRFASLESGQASFDVVHDDARPFRVEVGDATLLDLGTRFDVLRDADVTEVRVAEGVVMFNPDGEWIRLEPGRMLRSVAGEAEVHVGAVERDAVGAWRNGELVYRSVPLGQVARDLSRNLGLNVRADPSVAAQPVTGIVQLSGSREQVARRLEKLFQIKIRRNQSDWTLTQSS